MTKTQRLRMTIDITMTILSIILMGGNYLFPADIVHEILGVGLFFLWAIHIILNRHWYYLFMSLHIGLHVGCLFQNVTAKILPRILLALVCAYGIYAFIARGVWKYLILQQQFFFFDLERGYILFAIDYISIIILFATPSHLLAKSLKKGTGRPQDFKHEHP